MIEEEFETQENSSDFDSTDKTKKSKLKRKRIIFPVLLGVIAVITGMYFYNHAMTYVSTDDAYVEGHSIQVSPKVSGNIINVYIEDNEKVEKGKLLAEIDSADYQVKYEQAVAKLQAAIEKQKSASVNVGLTSITSSAMADQANSAVGAAQAGIQMSDKQISQVKAGLAQANNEIESVKAELDLAEMDFVRYQKLYSKGVVSKQDFDRVSTSLKTVKSKYNSSLEKASASKAQLQSAFANKEVSIKSLDQALGKYKGANTVPQQIIISDSARRIANAEIKQLEAAAKQAKLELSYTKIYAPKSGRITSRSVEEGVFVQAGQPLLAIVPENRWVVANFKETQLTNMKIGQEVFIKADAYPNKIFKGRVDSIQSSTGSKSSLFPPENAVGSFVKVVQRVPVKIVFTEKIDSGYSIVPGMSVVPEVKIK